MIKIAICDDNRNDISTIQTLVSEYMQERKLKYAESIFLSGEAFLKADTKFDLVFLDIVMGYGVDGIDVGKKYYSRNRKAHIIYTTNFRQYCEQAVNSVHAFAFLEKPIQKEKMSRQLEDVLEDFTEEMKMKQTIFFEVTHGTKEQMLPVGIREFQIDDIVYFEYINRKIRIKTKTDEWYFKESMKELIQKMRVYSFESCHQNYLVNLKYVSRLKGYDLYLKNGEKIPVSQKKSSEFRKNLNRFIQRNI